MLFRTRDLLVRQRTQTINALRARLAEFGIVAPRGKAHVGRLAALDEAPSALPGAVHELGGLLLERIGDLSVKIDDLERQLRKQARQDENARRLMTIPGIGPVTAMAIQAFAPPMETSDAGATSPPGWAWCRASTRPGASPGSAGYRRWASATSGAS